ncbi:hypothetical protein MTYP_02240 [Methylophilaceae bacterium]|nr:hypothetical protein MTYP_02240 [Methylophilaceae bacterium]
MGFVIVVALGLYLLLAIGVVAWAINYARKNGKSTKRWGWGAGLVMWLIPFWDWLPTVATHQYYCATEAGFWVYKTPEQWMKENPKMRVLDYSEKNSDDFLMEKTPDGGNKTSFSTRATSNIKYTKFVTPILVVTKNRRLEEFLFDEKQKNLLVKRITFQSGNISGAPNDLSDYKFWINLSQCDGDIGNTDKTTWQKTFNEFLRLGE